MSIWNEIPFKHGVNACLDIIDARINYLLAHPEIEHCNSKAYELANMAAEIKAAMADHEE